MTLSFIGGARVEQTAAPEKMRAPGDGCCYRYDQRARCHGLSNL